jgi:hypothetical protein
LTPYPQPPKGGTKNPLINEKLIMKNREIKREYKTPNHPLPRGTKNPA